MELDGFLRGVKVSIGRLLLLLFPSSSHQPSFSAQFHFPFLVFASVLDGNAGIPRSGKALFGL